MFAMENGNIRQLYGATLLLSAFIATGSQDDIMQLSTRQVEKILAGESQQCTHPKTSVTSIKDYSLMRIQISTIQLLSF